MAHIEKSVKEGKATRADAVLKKLGYKQHKRGRRLLSHSVLSRPAVFLTNRKEVITIDWSVLP